MRGGTKKTRGLRVEERKEAIARIEGIMHSAGRSLLGHRQPTNTFSRAYYHIEYIF